MANIPLRSHEESAALETLASSRSGGTGLDAEATRFLTARYGSVDAALRAASPPRAALSLPVQARLQVGPLDDPLEKEADRAAERVMAGGTGPGPLTSAGGEVQRKCAACEDEDQLVQRKGGGDASTGGSAAALVQDVVASSGEALDASTRQFMEGRFGADFSDVRVHEGARADASARALGAQAYTVGSHVVFEGRYPAMAPENAMLLAHELAHTVQQRGGTAARVQRAPAATAKPAAPTDTDRRQFVGETTKFLQGAADFYTSLTQIDASVTPIKADEGHFGDAAVRASLTRFRTMMSRQGEMVLKDLKGDAGLYRPLRAAYEAAVSALLAGAGRVSKTPVADLYERYRSLILEWAIPTQHFAGITTPLPSAAHLDARTHAAKLDVRGIKFSFLPDRPMSAAEARASKGHAETHFEAHGPVSFRSHGTRVTWFNAPPITAVVQLRIPSRLKTSDTSAYGRGTTAEDVATGRTSLGVHEGSHGADFLRFAREHPPPVFTGTVGMTVSDFRAAMGAYTTAVTAYFRALSAYSEQSTDCVGTTVDAAEGGATVRCAP